MIRYGSMMLYAFGGPMDGLIVRVETQDGRPATSSVGIGRRAEYDVRDLVAADGTPVLAFVHRALPTDEASARYREVSERSRRLG